MIDRLRGRIAAKSPTFLVVEVAGVGYGLSIPISTYDALGPPGAEAVLLCHVLLRDESVELYGFATEEERELFRALIGVSGVGPKIALATLSGMSPAEFRAAVSAGDVARLVSVKGVGRRTAERIIVELRDKVGVSLEEDMASIGGAAPELGSEAVSALVALGCKPKEALEAVKAALAELGAGTPVEEVVREALRRL